MRRLLSSFLLLTASLLPAQNRFTSWEPEIARIEAAIKETKPAPGGIVFNGSSSIRMWDLKSSFPDLTLFNAGFGGSMIDDSTHFAARVVLPLKPRLIVFYAGDNDSASGHSAARIADDFKAYAGTIHAALPECRVLYIPIKPSIARNALLPLQKEANALIARHCAAQPAWLEYLDLATPLMAADGSLRPELYQKDGLHLSPAGYAIWNALLRPHLLAK